MTAKARKLFKRERKLYQIAFEDPELKGFEVLMKGVSLGEFVDVTELSSKLEDQDGRTRENIEGQFTMLAAHLVSWNYADEDGNEVPATYDGLKQLDFADVMKIMYGWMQALTTVPKASNDDSSSTGISEELSLGLGSASRSPAS
jgi:hypothetical protein